MEVFRSGKMSTKVWGPTASVKVRIPAISKAMGAEPSWVLTDVKVGAKEIVDVCQCFNDAAFIYALGNDQSRCMISLTFIIFTSKCGEDRWGNVASGLNDYKKNRISKHTSPFKIGIGNFSVYGWLVGIDIGDADPERGTCGATVHFMMKLA